MSKTSSKEILKQLYNSDLTIRDASGNSFEIPEDGSLGLLALGYKGLIAWRKKKMDIRKEKKVN